MFANIQNHSNCPHVYACIFNVDGLLKLSLCLLYTPPPHSQLGNVPVVLFVLIFAETGLSDSEIGYIILGVIALIIIVLLIIYFINKKRKADQ